MAPSRQTAILIGGAVLAAALAANAFVSLRSLRVIGEQTEAVTSPVEGQRTLLALASAAQDAETGQRGYLLTGDPSYLAPYERARQAADSLYQREATLAAWNPVQSARLPGLRAALDATFGHLDETLRLYDEEGRAAALALVQSGQGRRAMDDLRERITVMEGTATAVRAEREARARAARRNARRATWAATAALAVLLAALVGGVRVADRRRERDAQALSEQATMLAERGRALESTNTQLSTALGEREAALGRVRAMQAQLVQQEKLAGMGRLTAGVAHELKNPLNFITGFAELTVELADELADAVQRGDTGEADELVASVRQNAQKVLQHGGRADRIVQSMLVHARGVTGDRRAVDLGEVVRAAAAQAAGPTGAHGVDIAVETDPALGRAEVVPESLARAVRNLIENAVYAVRERAGAGDPSYQPRVSVTVGPGLDSDGQPSAVVRVVDNGAGIPDTLFPRIFEPFFTTKGPGSGTGLGLSLAHDIAVGHGGSLLALRPPEGGAAFVLTVPLAADRPEPPGERGEGAEA